MNQNNTPIEYDRVTITDSEALQAIELERVRRGDSRAGTSATKMILAYHAMARELELLRGNVNTDPAQAGH